MSCLKTLDKCFLQVGSKVVLGEGWPKNIANPPSIALVIIIIIMVIITIIIIIITGGRLEGGLEGGLALGGLGSTTDEYYAQQYSQYYRCLVHADC